MLLLRHFRPGASLDTDGSVHSASTEMPRLDDDVGHALADRVYTLHESQM